MALRHHTFMEPQTSPWRPGSLLILPVQMGLWCLSLGYQLIIRCRNYMFRRGILKTTQLSIPVISVGNITTGGTGKTPIVQYLAEQMIQRGQKTAILTRGYKRKDAQSNQTTLVPHDLQLSTQWKAYGDEPSLLASALEKAMVLVDADRVRSGTLAQNQYQADCIIMDDGFSHQYLGRTLNLVILDAQNPFGYGYCLPRGLLREPLSALNRADAIIINRCEVGKPYPEIDAVIRRLGLKIPIFRFSTECRGIRHLQTNEFIPISSLPENNRLLAVCGIGNPQGFQQTLSGLKLTVSRLQEYSDHYDYTPEDIVQLTQIASRDGAAGVITTSKDGLKIKELVQESTIPWYILEIAVKPENAMEFMSFVGRFINLNANKMT